MVGQIAERTGIADWWIGKANREGHTFPVADIRTTARALGLVSVGRLPLGTQDGERQAGWMALAVAGSGIPAQDWGG